MSAFEFAFTLFGLVLGLALTAVLTGFAGILKARTSQPGQRIAIRLGWLTPLLAALVIFDLITFWLAAWRVREAVVVDLPILMFGAAVSGIYFVTASVIFPDDAAQWPDLDEWFDRHKGQIGAGIAIANVGFSSVYILAGRAALSDIPFMQYAYILLMLSLTVTRRRWQSLAALISLSVLAVWHVAGLPSI